MKKILVSIVGLLCAFTLIAQIATAGKMAVPPVVEKTLPNGLKVIVAENHEQPVVAMRIMFKAGTFLDPADKAGLSGMMTELIRKGTATRDANKISDEIDFIGGSLGAGADLDQMNATCQVLTKHFDKGLDLLSDIILNPTFPSDEVDRLRKQTIAQLMQAKDNANTIVDEQYRHYLFGDHPYAKPDNGTVESVQSITRDDIVAFWQKVFIPNNAVFFLVGDVNAAEMSAKIESKFGGWKQGTVPEMNYPKPSPTSGIKIVLINKPDATQSKIKIGNIGIDRYNPDIFTCRVMNYILGGGGFVSRLMIDIRQKRGLTYDVNSQFSFNRFPGDFTVSTFTRNDSTSKAILGILDELTTFRSGEVTPTELKDAISFYQGYFPRQFETPDQVASQMSIVELYGLGKDYLPSYLDKISGVNVAQIKAAAQKYIDPKNLLIVVVGKGDDIREGLKQIGPVTEVELSDL